MKLNIKNSAISGILFLSLLLLAVFVGILFFIFNFSENITGLIINLLLPLTIFFYAIFIWGFKIVGDKTENRLLKGSSIFLLLILVLIVVFHVGIMVFSKFFESDLLGKITKRIQLLGIFLFSGGGIILGISLLKLKNIFGRFAKITASFVVLANILWLIVMLIVSLFCFL
jgi:hypothetical protein